VDRGEEDEVEVAMSQRLFALSDLHVGYSENREIVKRLRPASASDWLIVAGDVGERFSDVGWVLATLREKFGTVIWMPGNHELWTHSADPVRLRGEDRYLRLVDLCRGLGVTTPEDPFLVWPGPHGPVVIVPLFLLYDYSFVPAGAADSRDTVARAGGKAIVCRDEVLLHSDPYPSREAWCRARTEESERRLQALDPSIPVVLANHYPLIREPTLHLEHQELAPWCGTVRTQDWHRRFNVCAVIYGHLHIPGVSWYDQVPFIDVSLGYPHERRRWPERIKVPFQILPGERRVPTREKIGDGS
jgi:3',5'-cyclic AMP phosphodiesterase CpdA